MKSIFSLLKKNNRTDQEPVVTGTTDSLMPSTPVLREAITGFIIRSLQPYVDEKGISIRGLRFYMACTNREQEEGVRVALYTDQPDLFRTSQLERKLLNHFIQLDPAWFFEWHAGQGQQLPDNCIRSSNFGLEIVHSGDAITHQCAKASVELLAGQAEQTNYTLDPQQQGHRGLAWEPFRYELAG